MPAAATARGRSDPRAAADADRPSRRGGSVAGPLLACALLPTLLYYFGLGSSMALGTMIATGLVLLGSVPAPGAPGRAPLGAGMAVPFGIAALVAAHLAVAAVLVDVDAGRALAALLPLALVIGAGLALGGRLAATTDAAVDRATGLVLLAMFCVASLSLAGLSVPAAVTSSYAKPMFPFAEPSHFALVATPFLLAWAVRARGGRRAAGLVAAVAIALLVQNVTLLLGTCLAVAVCVRWRYWPLWVAALILLVQLDPTYYVERLNPAGDVQNLSNLVYLQGWQQLLDSLARSHGWGIGFQQLGLAPGEAEVTDAIVALLGDYANVLDGGFTLAKLVAEFGVFGIALAACFVACAWRAWLVLRRTAAGTAGASAASTFARCILVAYGVELFVRGQGYFTGTLLLLAAAAGLLAHRPGRSRVRAAGGPTSVAHP